MRPRLPVAILLRAVLLPLICAACLCAQQPAPTYDLAGEVVNSETGQPIGGALVEGFFQTRQAQFTASNGTFAFTGLPRGQFSVVAKKPGFFNEQQLGTWSSREIANVPDQTPLIVKLVPEAIIFGQVTGANGQPLERILVSAQRWQIQDGRRQLQRLGGTITDDRGNFRIAELHPGTYFLSFRPFGSRSAYGGLGSKTADTPGYGTEFYPGVNDFTSATPITLAPGTQFHADQVLTTEPTFAITGRVIGANGARGISITVMNAEENPTQRAMRMDPSTGQFQISGVPAGKYMLVARAWNPIARSSPEAQLSAYLPISITSDMSGVVLALAPGISIPIHIDDETANNNSSDPHRVFIRFLPDSAERFFERAATAPRYEHGRALPASVNSLVPGTYSVEARAFGSFYVADLRCGTVDLLQDNLTVGPTGSLPPIDITLRDDGAQLTGTVTQDGKPTSAGIVVYSPDYPKRSELVRASDNGSFFAGELAPGTYQVFAVSNPETIEFRNPIAVQSYLAGATSVTLGAGGQSSVQLELPSAGEDEP